METSPADDLVQPFRIENGMARGRLARLGLAVQAVVADRPEPVAALLSDMLSLAALAAGIFRFDGVFSLQVKGDGPVGMAVVDFTNDGALRGFAKFDAGAVAALGEDWRRRPVPALLGGGRLAFTVDRGRDMNPYQGIVALDGATLADCAHAYFRQSDQFAGAVRLCSRRDAEGAWRAGGLMLQRLPEPGDSGEDYEEQWRRAVIMMSGVRDRELLDPLLHPHRLLYRLFHQDGVRVYDPTPLEMRCRCSSERVEAMLRSFPREEIEGLKVGDEVVVTCEFCGRGYRYPADALDLVYHA